MTRLGAILTDDVNNSWMKSTENTGRGRMSESENVEKSAAAGPLGVTASVVLLGHPIAFRGARQLEMRHNSSRALGVNLHFE